MWKTFLPQSLRSLVPFFVDFFFFFKHLGWSIISQLSECMTEVCDTCAVFYVYQLWKHWTDWSQIGNWQTSWSTWLWLTDKWVLQGVLLLATLCLFPTSPVLVGTGKSFDFWLQGWHPSEHLGGVCRAPPRRPGESSASATCWCKSF